LIQSQINNILQDVYRPRQAAFGFIRNRDIRKNAQRHTSNRWVFNIDLEDFFPSINFGRVRGLFINKPYELPRSVATIIAQICSHNDELPQGAPTSPVLSNMICRRLDYELTSLAIKHHCTYSRYADDITFSSNRPLFPAAIGVAKFGENGGTTIPGDELIAAITRNGFRINERKTRLQRSGRRQTVTGLVVNRKVNVPRSFIRDLRGMLHAWEKYGLAAAQDAFETKYFNGGLRAPFMKVPRLIDHIGGRISYIGFIRGKGDALYIRFRGWYKSLDSAT